MCFNYKVSLLTFVIGTVFSILLIKYGNPQYKLENKVSGIFLIFISLIQFMDFLFWIDLKNVYGINKITTILGAILNVAQPTILYIIKYIYYKPNIFEGVNLLVAILNLLYFIYFLKVYIQFLFNEKLVTSTENNHLKWPWIKYSNPSYYLFLLAINIFYLFNFKYALFLFIILYFLLYISYKYFYYNKAELWCFFGSFIPLILFFASFCINKIPSIPFFSS
uniref:Uncharacterized protein n=1 Tax=viral metagenome TaxID=1070528 RepID=A0A6C0IE62_9ZZZZ